MDPNSFRLLMAGASGLPEIGEAFEGGFFAGLISHTSNSVPTHGLIVAPQASTESLPLKTTNTATAGTDSPFDGALNSANMNNANHPAAQYCEALNIGGYSDWYLPARYELDIAYQNLKPTTFVNNTDWGINPYSVPERTVNRTVGSPTQTSIAAFQSGGAEAFPAAFHFSSTDLNDNRAWGLTFDRGQQFGLNKSFNFQVRAFRKFAL